MLVTLGAMEIFVVCALQESMLTSQDRLCVHFVKWEVIPMLQKRQHVFCAPLDPALR